MLFVTLFLVISEISQPAAPIPSLHVLFVLRLTLLAFLAIWLVTFVLFVLANMMTRPVRFSVMKLFALLSTARTFLSRKRRNMVEKLSRLFRGLCSHVLSGCSVCTGFVRHIFETVVSILKGGD